jgi:hypothetical protein
MMTIAFVHLPEANADINLAHVAHIERGNWPQLMMAMPAITDDGNTDCYIIPITAADLIAFDAALRTFRVNNHAAPMPEGVQ